MQEINISKCADIVMFINSLLIMIFNVFITVKYYHNTSLNNMFLI